jgi:hypothetical protein
MGREELLKSFFVWGAGWVTFVLLIRHFFAQKSIEYYKKEYQKNLQDYNLYSEKRNEILQSLFKSAIEVSESLPELNWPVNYYNFSNFINEETVLGIFQDIGSCTKEEITGIKYHFQWKHFEELAKIYLLKRVGHRIKIFHNELTQNLVYLDDALENSFKELEKLLNRSHNLMIEKNYSKWDIREKMNHEDLEKRQQIENLLKTIKQNIKKLIWI